jgi:hypothetical protein
MNDIKEKFSGEYSKLNNGNDSNKFLNDDDIDLEDTDKANQNQNKINDLRKRESDSLNSNIIEVLDQDGKTTLVKEDHHIKVSKNDSNMESNRIIHNKLTINFFIFYFFHGK